MQACERYSAAWKMKPSSHSALYNWGVALSDMSRVLKSTDRTAANALLSEAADKYATSLQHQANNPQVPAASETISQKCFGPFRRVC